MAAGQSTKKVDKQSLWEDVPPEDQWVDVEPAHSTVAPQPGIGSRIVRGVGRGIAGLVTAPYHLAKAAVMPPQNEDEAIASMTMPPGFGLLTHRTVVAPAKQSLRESVEAFKQGENVRGAVHGAAAAVPMVGPYAASLYERGAAGDVAGAIAEGATVALLPKAPKMLPRRIPVAPKMVNPNPVEAAAVEFGMREGIPVDAGTATGNPAVRGAQWLADRSVAGSFIAEKAKAEQAAALTRTGHRLAGQVNARPELTPGPAVVPEQAGAAVASRLEREIAKHKAEADTAYDTFRQHEARPENVRKVPVRIEKLPETVNMEGKPVKLSSLNKEQRAAVGYPDIEPEVAPLVDNAVDMRLKEIQDTFSQGVGDLSGKGKNIDTANMNAQARANLTQKDTGFGHLPVKRSIPEVADMKEPPGRIAKAIEKDKDNPLFLEVKRRVAQDTLDRFKDEIESANVQARERNALMEPEPPVTGEPALLEGGRTRAVMKDVSMPVDMRPIKQALQPIYDRMTQWMEPAKRNASPGYTAIQSILKGDDYVPASVAESGLSGLKGLAREAELPDMANVSQGIGRFSTKMLQDAIDTAIGEATLGGKEALVALRAGRTAHAAKMDVHGIWSQLRDEPVQAFNQATWAKDAGIDYLRQLERLAPEEMTKIGRAYLEDLFTKATKEGGFARTQGLWNQWTNLGNETKKILFKDPVLVNNLNDFFLLAKKIAENPNPSGTGHIVSLSGQAVYTFTNPGTGIPMMIAGAALSKLLHSPAVVRALTQGLKIPVSKKLASAMAAAQIMRVAGDNVIPFPKVAASHDRKPQNGSQTARLARR